MGESDGGRTLNESETGAAFNQLARVLAESLAEALGPLLAAGGRAEDRDSSWTRLPVTLSVDEAARLLGVSRSAMYEAVRVGTLPSLRLGRRIRIPTGRLLQAVGGT
jgi:excisionase family DNA binding protein